jgi:hypothetical protein
MGCLRQHFRPGKETKTEIPGTGDCNGTKTGIPCKPHPDNKNCKMYHEITSPQEFEVKEKEKSI